MAAEWDIKAGKTNLKFETRSSRVPVGKKNKKLTTYQNHKTTKINWCG